jgi:predicted nucleic acid-binding protein
LAKIFWDTNLFIYLFENHAVFGDRVVKIRQAMLHRQDSLLTSALTVGEILVKPIQSKRQDLVSRYQDFFQRPGISVIPFDIEAATSFAAIRQDKRIRPPDAIQMACAAAANTDLFITNDDRLSKFHVQGIHFITSLDQAPV